MIVCLSVSPGACEIVVLGTTVNTISISWGDAGANDNGYTVSIAPSGVTQTNLQMRTATFSSLTPGVRYTITLLCFPNVGAAIEATAQPRTSMYKFTMS